MLFSSAQVIRKEIHHHSVKGALEGLYDLRWETEQSAGTTEEQQW